VLYALIDLCCIVANSFVAFLIRFTPHNWRDLLAPDQLVGMDNRYAGFLLLEIVLILLFCQTQRLYRTPLEQPFAVESLAIVKAVAFATVLLTAFVYLSGVRIVSRGVVFISSVLNAIALIAWRYSKRRLVTQRIGRGIGVRNALIVGAGSVGQELARLFRENKQLRYQVVGFFDETEAADSRPLARMEHICRAARARFADEIFITMPSDRELVKEAAIAARRNRFAITVIPDVYDGFGWNAPLRRIGSLPAMDLHWTPIPTASLIIKRAMDIWLATIGLLLSSPLIAVFALLIRCNSKGSPFYWSKRVGQKGSVFSCYKLRTMFANADEEKDALRLRNEREGPFFKISDDPRVTRVGRFLRRYSLDELPQLWNVLLGDMSLVGPRPHPLDDYSLYAIDDLRRLEVKPGLTGLWQITARRDPSFQRSMRLDLEYIENWNLRLDLQILLRTFSAVLRAEGC
jgi:exopolysaccharide biosynthesis polyprenyl glycosylphosphotransferase